MKPNLPDLGVVDASKLLREMRLIKDEYELDLIRNPGDISDWAQDKMKEAIRPGKTPVEIETEVAHMIAVGPQEDTPQAPLSDLMPSLQGWGQRALCLMAGVGLLVKRSGRETRF